MDGGRWWKLLKIVSEMVWFYLKIAPFAIRMYYSYYVSSNRSKDVRRDLPYGPQSRNRVDIYLPPSHSSPVALNKTAAPLVVFIHGGAWSSGGKHQYSTLARALQARGFGVAVANYTLHPAGQVQHMVRDLALLFKFLERNAASFGVDLERVYGVGHSAGAHLLALFQIRLALLEHKLRRVEGSIVDDTEDVDVMADDQLQDDHHYHAVLDHTHILSRLRIQGIVGIGGPYHIGDHYKHESWRGVENLSAMRPAMGGIANFDNHSPTVLLDRFDLSPSALPPFFLLHGNRDGTVPSSSSLKLAEVLRARGHSVELHLDEGLGHADYILHLMNDRSPHHTRLMNHLLSLFLSPPPDFPPLTTHQ